MSPQAPSTPLPSRHSPSSPAALPAPPVRDRDYLLDRHGVIFKVIGDIHPDGMYRLTGHGATAARDAVATALVRLGALPPSFQPQAGTA
jgi:hypothetical protein